MPKGNAELIFESIKKYSDIQNFIGQQEKVYLDFKETNTTSSAISDDDKKNFSKAASGFAHQDGGVVIWGIEARKNKEGIDEAISLKPITSLKRFFGDINNYIKISTIPVVDGILNKKIYSDDNKQSDAGFLVTFFPRSDFEHAYKGLYYKRYGDSFVPLLTPSDVKALFFRSQLPILEFENQINMQSGSLYIPIIIKNIGKNLAKNVQVLIAFEPNLRPTPYDQTGNLVWKISSCMNSADKAYALNILLNGDVVIHPTTKLAFASLVFHDSKSLPEKMKYKILAENMYPVEGELNLELN